MQNLLKNLETIFKIFVLICLAVLSIELLFLNGRVNKISSLLNLDNKKSVTVLTDQSFPTKSDVESLISSAISTISGVTPKPSSIPSQTPKGDRIVYIPLGSSGSTQATSWTDVPNAEIWLNFNGEYGQKALAWWDAFLRVDNANGTTYARLFDVTHGIAVDGSTISVSSTATPTDVESENLRLWSGRNLYRVQIKSLNSSTAFFDSGRIKISY